MADPNTNFLYGTAKPGPYRTPLSMSQESNFRQWVQQNRVPFDDSPRSDYDMRGFWLAQQKGDPNARTAASGFDGQMHYPDTYKTPYHESFSAESKYATPNAPQWSGNDQSGFKLMGKVGNVVKDESTAKSQFAYKRKGEGQ